jgi:hypothetical protein
MTAQFSKELHFECITFASTSGPTGREEARAESAPRATGTHLDRAQCGVPDGTSASRLGGTC